MNAPDAKIAPATTDSPRTVDEPSLKAGLRQSWGWAVMFGAGENSFCLFAAQIRMPTFFFGLLIGIPQLLGPLAQALSANLLDRHGRRKWLVEVAVLAQMLCFVPLAALPVLALSGWNEQEPWATLLNLVFLAAATVYVIGGNFTIPPWSSLVSVLVPHRLRAEYFGRLNRHMSFLTLVSQIGVGGLLFLCGQAAEPDSRARLALWVFAGAFALSGLARFHSLLQVRRVQDPPYVVPPDSVFTFVQFLRRARESNFVHFVLYSALIYFGTMLAGPYFLPYWTYDLGYASWQWVVMSSVTTFSSIVTLFFWERFSDRFGNKKTLAYTGFSISVIPLLWMVSANFYYLAAVNLLSGMAWAGFGLSQWNYILEAVTPPKRARCVAYFNIVCGVGIFAGALLGGWIEKFLPAVEVTPGHTTRFFYLLLLSGLCRLLAAAVFVPTFRELREVQPFSLPHWFFQITAVRYPVGVILDFFAGEDGKDEEDSPPGGA